jgi:XTP/dITP diphosphohydrolase
MQLYVATTNPGKLRDFAAAAEGTAEVLPLPNVKSIPEPIEDAPTFAGNARLKALYYSQQAPGLLVLADDSGLAVDALHGAPGVRSARFADDHHFAPDPAANKDDRNNALLLHQLARQPESERTARFLCALALARDGQLLHTAEGQIEGLITTAPRGPHGFGYDPLFLLPDLDQTMAELDAQTKWRCSHRGRAFHHLLQQLKR